MKKLLLPIIIILLLILGFVLYQNSGYKTLNRYNDNKISSLENKVKDLQDNIEKDSENQVGENQNETTEKTTQDKDSESIVAVSAGATFTTIYVPTYSTYSGEIEMIAHEIPYTESVLKETYEKVFEQNSSKTGYNGLIFDSVSLADKTATVNLTGSWYPAGDMSGYYMRQTINQAAFYYDSINVVKVTLNGKIFDWCIDDMSDGESGCPDKAKYWIDTK